MVSSTASSEPNSGAIVSVEDLQKTYRSGWLGRGQVQALRRVSLRAERGQVFGLLGPNGAGKTTLIKVLLGVIGSSGGRASLFGLAAGSATARRRVGYLPESLRIDRHHTARTALRYYGRLSGLDGAAIRSRSDRLLDLVGLAGRDRESVRRFSKGMLQRLGLAQALMHDPDLLVLDEPTDGLDPVGRSEVRGVIERLRDDGKTIFLNSHILHEVELVCTHLAIMASGRVLATGPLAALRAGQLDENAEPANGRKIIETEFSLPADVPAGAFLRQALGEGECEPTGPIHLADPPIRTLRHGDESADHRAEITGVNQADIDRLVDAIRAAGGSLMAMTPQRVTLEDTFMRLVQQASTARTS
ncbi:MAG: ABC transporter ATP-binding protein [Planctomycetota bacterium]